MPSFVLLAAATAFCLVLFSPLFKAIRRQFGLGVSRLPPGPEGNFITGNLAQMPRVHAYLGFADWAKAYGTPFLHICGLIRIKSRLSTASRVHLHLPSFCNPNHRSVLGENCHGPPRTARGNILGQTRHVDERSPCWKTRWDLLHVQLKSSLCALQEDVGDGAQRWQ